MALFENAAEDALRALMLSSRSISENQEKERKREREGDEWYFIYRISLGVA